MTHTTTVGEIMSRGPQLLRPTVTVRQAADQMRRFGHEGFPVTDNGKVVGLLTRRAVDRALAHGMESRPISEIMETGSLVVYPDDTVQRLQQLMIDHQWGQVPVADRDTGEVIGIVTRTDVLQSIGAGNQSNGTANIADRLEHVLAPGRLALLKLIAGEAERVGSPLHLVGGFVRDLLLDLPALDFDLVVEGDAIALASALARLFGGKVHSHARFSTAKWRLDPSNPSLRSALGALMEQLPESVDLVSARTEFYTHPSALPSVTEGSIKLDLHRRDFSINTLALRLDGARYGQLSDYWGGLRDLHERQIRVLHSLSFVDDPTRMLRAVRLEQRLGFRIEARTLQLMDQALPLLADVSGERIRAELLDILLEPTRPRILARLAELGLLRAIHPALDWDEWIAGRFTAFEGWSPPEAWRIAGDLPAERIQYGLWLYRLDRTTAESVCRRFAFSQADRAVIVEAGRHGCPLDGQASAITDCLEELPEQALIVEWLTVEESSPRRAALDRFLETWRWVRPRADGNRLRELGLPPGPAYREILHELRAAWLDERIASEAEEADLLRRMLEERIQRG